MLIRISVMHIPRPLFLSIAYLTVLEIIPSIPSFLIILVSSLDFLFSELLVDSYLFIL